MYCSFRDPSGQLYIKDDNVLRLVNSNGMADFEAASNSKVVRSLVSSGNFIESAVLPEKDESIDRKIIPPEPPFLFARHRKIQIVNYPYEWAPEMLFAAAELTLDLAEQLLAEDLGLKDADPSNIIFESTRPVFVDWLSIEMRNPRDPIWLAQSQFIQSFILPLLANKEFGISLREVFLPSRTGLDIARFGKLARGWQRLKQPFFSLVTIPNMLSGFGSPSSSIYEQKLLNSSEKAQFVLSRQFKRLRKLLMRVAPSKTTKSAWASYHVSDQHYSEAYLQTKLDSVSKWLDDKAPKTVLDIGCNTGSFSEVAARHGASVVAIDSDQASISNAYRNALKDDLEILTLNIDIARPSPATGWRHSENSDLLSRIEGRFDCILLLAVVHHLLVTETIPLAEIFDFAAGLTTGTLIVEYIPPNDPKFCEITRGRGHLFERLDQAFFEQELKKQFRIIKKNDLPDSSRVLYFLAK